MLGPIDVGGDPVHDAVVVPIEVDLIAMDGRQMADALDEAGGDTMACLQDVDAGGRAMGDLGDGAFEDRGQARDPLAPPFGMARIAEDEIERKRHPGQEEEEQNPGLGRRRRAAKGDIDEAAEDDRPTGDLEAGMHHVGIEEVHPRRPLSGRRPLGMRSYCNRTTPHDAI